MTATEMLQDTLKNDMELFRAKVGNIGIVDIGTIVSIEKGRAVAHGSSFIGGQQAIYENAEVIFPGNEGGCFSCECVGTACLIFIPRSCIPSIDNKYVRFEAKPYDKAGIKVMPIGNDSVTDLSVGRNANGVFNIMSVIYSMEWGKDTVALDRADGKASASMDANGGLHVSKQGDNGTYYKDIEDGSVTEKWTSKDKDVQWTDTLNSDGSRSFVQRDPRDDQSDPLFSISIAADGTATITSSKAFSYETKDALTLKGKSVTIEATDGSLTTKAKNAVAISSTNDNITIDSGSGKTVNVNSGNLEVQ